MKKIRKPGRTRIRTHITLRWGNAEESKDNANTLVKSVLSNPYTYFLQRHMDKLKNLT